LARARTAPGNRSATTIDAAGQVNLTLLAERFGNRAAWKG